MKIKVSLIEGRTGLLPFVISQSETVEFIASCPTEVRMTSKDYPRQEFVIQIHHDVHDEDQGDESA